MPLELSPEVFVIFAALVEEETGISYRPDDRELLQGKLVARAVEAGFDSLLDYYYYLRYDPGSAGERQELIDSLVVNESYLFREQRQLRYIVSELLAPAVAAGRIPRVWSAACAAGEEPLGLAMLLAERGILARVEIVASDISRRTLGRARRGELSRRALRDVAEPGLVARWVERTDGGGRVRASLLRHIEFRQVNLTDAAAVRQLTTFDVILCRNVLIYFSDALQRRVVQHLLERLEPDGTLWVGLSESLMRLEPYVTCEERQGLFFYRAGAR